VRWAFEHPSKLTADPADSADKWHVGRNPTDLSLERYACIPPEGNRFNLFDLDEEDQKRLIPDCWMNKRSGSTDVFGRLRWDKPSVTIRTEFYKPEKGRYLHPEEDRPITHREAMRIQTFPDDFEWRGGFSSVARQVGNAVPPQLAYCLALSISDALSKMDEVPTCT